MREAEQGSSKGFSREPKPPKMPGSTGIPGSIASPSFLDSPATPIAKDRGFDRTTSNDASVWLNRTESNMSLKQEHEKSIANATGQLVIFPVSGLALVSGLNTAKC